MREKGPVAPEGREEAERGGGCSEGRIRPLELAAGAWRRGGAHHGGKGSESRLLEEFLGVKGGARGEGTWLGEDDYY